MLTLEISWLCEYPYLLFMVQVLKDEARYEEEASQGMWEEQGDSDKGKGRWRPAYFSLVALDKLLGQYSECVKLPATEEIWPTLTNGLLLHPHAWIRTSSCRVLGQCFGEIGSPEAVWGKKVKSR